jgi:hypothetical protein
VISTDAEEPCNNANNELSCRTSDEGFPGCFWNDTLGVCRDSDRYSDPCEGNSYYGCFWEKSFCSFDEVNYKCNPVTFTDDTLCSDVINISTLDMCSSILSGPCKY